MKIFRRHPSDPTTEVIGDIEALLADLESGVLEAGWIIQQRKAQQTLDDYAQNVDNQLIVRETCLRARHAARVQQAAAALGAYWKQI